MQFLRTVFWVIVAVALLIFAAQNNNAVTVNLWGGLQADVKLWLLVIAPFLLGFLSTWIFHRVSVWQQRRQASGAAQRAAVPPGYDPQPGVATDGAMVSGARSVSVSPAS